MKAGDGIGAFALLEVLRRFAPSNRDKTMASDAQHVSIRSALDQFYRDDRYPPVEF
jgi:hypothetical protein